MMAAALDNTPPEKVCNGSTNGVEKSNSRDWVKESIYGRVWAMEELRAILADGTLRLRPLALDDYHKGYLELLAQLTVSPSVSFDVFRDRFRAMEACKDTYFVLVVEDTLTERVCASATLVVEQKFLRGCNARGRIEDVVVDQAFRGRRLAKLLLQSLLVLAEQRRVYKVSLECKDHLLKFYEQFGFAKEVGNNYMVLRYEQSSL